MFSLGSRTPARYWSGGQPIRSAGLGPITLRGPRLAQATMSSYERDTMLRQIAAGISQQNEIQAWISVSPDRLQSELGDLFSSFWSSWYAAQANWPAVQGIQVQLQNEDPSQWPELSASEYSSFSDWLTAIKQCHGIQTGRAQPQPGTYPKQAPMGPGGAPTGSVTQNPPGASPKPGQLPGAPASSGMSPTTTALLVGGGVFAAVLAIGLALKS